MKKIFLIILLGCVVAPAFAQDSDRVYLTGKLDIRYVANLNAPAATYTPEILNKTAIAAGTETGAFWTNAAMLGPQALVRALLRPSTNGGDAELQAMTASILKISRRTIMFYLLDDSTAGVTVQQTAIDRYTVCPSDRQKAWPCASNYDTGPYGGEIRMGTVYFTSMPTSREAYATFLHELVHTQDFSDGRSHLFHIRVGRRVFHLGYGSDNTHYYTEAVPDRAMAIKEALANVAAFIYHPTVVSGYFNWFATNDAVLVETTNITPEAAATRGVSIAHISPDFWLFDQIIRAGGVEIPPRVGPYAVFRIRNLPKPFIVYNEVVTAMIFSEYVRHVGRSKFFNAFRQINPQMRNVSTSAFALMFQALCNNALPAGQTIATISTAGTSGGPKPYLLPLAYVDYFTGYASTRDQFRAIFENMGFMDPWINYYWDHGREQVRSAVPIGATPTIGQLTSIAVALGITTSH